MLYSGEETKEVKSENTLIKSKITGKENQEIESLREKDKMKNKRTEYQTLLDLSLYNM